MSSFGSPPGACSRRDRQRLRSIVWLRRNVEPLSKGPEFLEPSFRMIVINGKRYNTIPNTAKKWGVSVKTARSYIAKKILPKPPKVKQGLRTIYHFPPWYMEKADAWLERYRKQKAGQGRIVDGPLTY